MDKSRSCKVQSGGGQPGTGCSPPSGSRSEIPTLPDCAILPIQNPVPPSDILKSEKSVPLDQVCRSGEQDLAHNTESRGKTNFLSTKYQNSLRKSAYSCHRTQTAKSAD